MRRTTLISGLLASGLTLTGLSTGIGAAEAADTRTVTGTTREVVREAPDGGAPERDTVLQTRDGLVQLTDSSRVPMNTRVTVRATPTADDQLQVTRVLASAAAPDGTPEQWQGMRSVYVAIVTPANQKANTNTATKVDSLVTQASDYWSSQTRGQVSFGVVETARYSSVSLCDEADDLWNEAVEKFGHDENGDPNALGPGKHLLVVAPNDGPGCDYGFGTIGGLGVDQDANAVMLSAPDKSLYAHELGHNLGLDHSNSVMCGKVQDGVWSNGKFTGCRAHDYDDLLDVMGYSGPTFGEGNLNIAHQDDFGIQSDVIRSITTPGTTSVTIAPLSSTSTAVRGVRVTDVQGQTYFVQYRTRSGRDAVAARNPPAVAGGRGAPGESRRLRGPRLLPAGRHPHHARGHRLPPQHPDRRNPGLGQQARRLPGHVADLDRCHRAGGQLRHAPEPGPPDHHGARQGQEEAHGHARDPRVRHHEHPLALRQGVPADQEHQEAVGDDQDGHRQRGRVRAHHHQGHPHGVLPLVPERREEGEHRQAGARRPVARESRPTRQGGSGR